MLNRSFDERRDLAIGKDSEEAIQYSVSHWIETAQKAIKERGKFHVALSGGSTPNIIYQTLSKQPYAHQLDWSKIWLFWGDERAVAPDDPESNYHAAMQHGLSILPLNPHQIFRMEAEKKPIEQAAEEYEALLEKHLGKQYFDLVMLGVGEDGHTASLFPNTKALKVEDRLVVANWVPQKDCWRMTLTYSCIRASRAVVIYAHGPSKKEIVKQVLQAPYDSPFPSSKIGEADRKALWMLDADAASLLA